MQPSHLYGRSPAAQCLPVLNEDNEQARKTIIKREASLKYREAIQRLNRSTDSDLEHANIARLPVIRIERQHD